MSTCNKAGTYSLTDDQVIELPNFLIDNIYIHVGSVECVSCPLSVFPSKYCHVSTR